VAGDRGGAQLLMCIIHACAANGDYAMVKTYLSKANTLGVADMAALSWLIKGLMTAGNEATAESVLTEMRKMGLHASQANYHGLLHSRVVAQDRSAAWRLVQEMQDAGFKPNAVTCSILLKMIVTPAHANQLPKVLQMVEAMEMPSDDVLLYSMMQACLRAERLDLLAELIRRPLGELPLTAPLYGSMIKAFGQARNLEHVRCLWNNMNARGVEQSAVTLGCMVEALVVNGEADEAWMLVQEIWQKDHQRQLVNTVTYSSLLKGFTNQPDKVMELYKEMKARQVECNTITYNTILNCFAQCRAMCRVPQILTDMRTANPPAEPDMVTYSTLVKGFCASGDLDTALGLLEEVRKQGTFMADEMLYNTLLSGCAREQRISDALQIVNEMRITGTAPSNYTLSMLVKLLGRCKRLGQLFSIVEELTAEFGIRLNIQVYTCMIQACLYNRQPAKALALLDRLIGDGLRPDEKTNLALVRGFLQLGHVAVAVDVIRRACRDNDHTCVETGCADLVIAKLGAESETAKSLTKEVEAARYRIRHASSHGTSTRKRPNQGSGNCNRNYQHPRAFNVVSGLGQQT